MCDESEDINLCCNLTIVQNEDENIKANVVGGNSGALTQSVKETVSLMKPAVASHGTITPRVRSSSIRKVYDNHWQKSGPTTLHNNLEGRMSGC